MHSRAAERFMGVDNRESGSLTGRRLRWSDLRTRASQPGAQRRRTDSWSRCHPFWVDQHRFCRPAPHEDLQRDLRGAWPPPLLRLVRWSPASVQMRTKGKDGDRDRGRPPQANPHRGGGSPRERQARRRRRLLGRRDIRNCWHGPRRSTARASGHSRTFERSAVASSAICWPAGRTRCACRRS